MEDRDPTYGGLTIVVSMALVAVSGFFVRRDRLCYIFGSMFAASFAAYYLWIWRSRTLEMGRIIEILFFGLYACGLVYYFRWLPRELRCVGAQRSRAASITLGIMCWVLSIVGAYWAFFLIVIQGQGLSMIGAGHKPLLPFDVLILPAFSVTLGAYVVFAAGSERVRTRFLLLVLPFGVAVLTALFSVLAGMG
jgi:hypothetical protein